MFGNIIIRQALFSKGRANYLAIYFLISKIVLRLWDWHTFISLSLEILNGFNNLTLKQVSWITKAFFKKLENHFLVESITIENAIFYINHPLSKASAQTNRMVSTKWTYPKEWNFDTNYFILKKNSISIHYEYLLWSTNYQMSILLLFVNSWILFEGASIHKTEVYLICL